MRFFSLYIFICFCGLFLHSCIEDGFTTSPSDQPLFSTDTLDFGVVYTEEQTSTYRLTVYNRHSKGLNISNVSMSGEHAGLFRLNVDGMSGVSFSDVEIRANDSIFVFLSADLPKNGVKETCGISANLDFLVNGRLSSVVVKADGQDITRVNGLVLDVDTRFSDDAVYQVKDSLVVPENVTLSLDPGVRILFHDKAKLVVRGSLIAHGTPEKPIFLTGDRTGNVITDVSFDLMSKQWHGVEFTEESSSNALSFIDISNTSYGVVVKGDGLNCDSYKLSMENVRLRNSGDCGIKVIGASVEAYGCQFSEAASALVYLMGGDSRFDHCTVSNNYLFAFPQAAAWTIVDPSGFDEYIDFAPTKLLVTNSITYGLSADVYPGDFSDQEIYFKRCLFKSAGTDDDNFVESLWDADPLFHTVRNEYLFDYRLLPDSPAIGAADISLTEHPLATDFYGMPLTTDLGAYAFVQDE